MLDKEIFEVLKEKLKEDDISFKEAMDSIKRRLIVFEVARKSYYETMEEAKGEYDTLTLLIVKISLLETILTDFNKDFKNKTENDFLVKELEEMLKLAKEIRK